MTLFDKFFKKETTIVEQTQPDMTKLWRITAHRLQLVQNSHGFMIASTDHFTVRALNEAEAIGIFKTRPDGMKWYVIEVAPEQIMGATVHA